MSLESELERLRPRFEEQAKKCGVVGATLAIGRNDEVFETATGFVNFGAQIKATPDSVYQIGSITKLFTTTLAMQLVDEGLVDLESPVQQVLPEFQVADAEASRTITLAQLLCHTSGIDGDYFLDTGSGDDGIERFVLACSALPQLHRPGERVSYCNAGFVVAGRMIEKVRAKPWHRVLKEQLLAPLGLSTMGTRAEEAIFHRAAVGHIQLPHKSDPQIIPIWSLAASNAPAGATPFGRARDLISFAQTHLNDGVAAHGTRILSAASVALMKERHAKMPDRAMIDAWGLGWMFFDWGGRRILGHDGSTLGQASFLRVDPQTGTIVSLLTTGGDATALYRDIFGEAMGQLCDLTLPPTPDDCPSVDVPLDRYVGRYRRLAAEYEIRVQDGSLELTATGLKTPISLLPRQKTKLRAIARDAFVVEQPGGLARSPVLFGSFDENDRPAHIEVGLRSAPRCQ